MLRDPKPCSEVNLANGEENGYALLQDLFGRTHYLLIPTRRVYGIESPELLLPDSPNYWQAAWLAKKYIASQFGQILPRNKVGMAINSAMQRSQDQLHIHIDCIQPEVLTQLSDYMDSISEQWTLLPFRLMGRQYMARRLEVPELLVVNPFLLLYSTNAAAHSDMSKQTEVIIGANLGQGREGFVVLSQQANPADQGSGHGEELLDRTCALMN
jgi:CDP-diacylglycerol pyrophosphatase